MDEALQKAAESGGARSLIGHIQGVLDPAERRRLYPEARHALNALGADRRTLDDSILLLRTGIEDNLRQADVARAAGDQDVAMKCLDAANILAYNLAADLCECWPNDPVKRERRHLEAGLEIASQAVVWRNALGKPPDRRAMAYWAVGMHHLSLGNHLESLGAFDTALRLAAEAIEAGSGARDPMAQVKAGADFGPTLYAAYAGIVSGILGDAEGAKRYDRACEAFEKTAASGDGEAKEDAEFGLGQLRYVKQRFGGAR